MFIEDLDSSSEESINEDEIHISEKSIDDGIEKVQDIKIDKNKV